MTGKHSRRRPRLAVTLVIAAGLASLSLPPAGHAEPATVANDAPRGAATTRPAVAPGFGAIGYYQAHCVSCHGPYGSYYGDGFAADLSDAELAETVDEMCAGPGQAPLEGDPLAAEVAYHRSLARPDGPPFVAVVSRDAGGVKGEVTPGSAVRVGDRDAVVDGHDWHLDATADAPIDPAAPVVAERAGRSTTLTPGEGLYSHRRAATD